MSTCIHQHSTHQIPPVHHHHLVTYARYDKKKQQAAEYMEKNPHLKAGARSKGLSQVAIFLTVTPEDSVDLSHQLPALSNPHLKMPEGTTIQMLADYLVDQLGLAGMVGDPSSASKAPYGGGSSGSQRQRQKATAKNAAAAAAAAASDHHHSPVEVLINGRPQNPACRMNVLYEKVWKSRHAANTIMTLTYKLRG